ncbi:phage neck terminator protein [Lactiplantibacillus paraxiangfangensis]|uniref:phage neck terminator protein n=1 Tax=Lactiplantibacillus paraxiangfangensis TaxID=3076224 RepID=UPI0030C74DC4
MAYQARTFDWPKVINGLAKTLSDITQGQVSVYDDGRVPKTAKYPFITFADENPYTELFHSTYKVNDQFDRTVSISCYAETDGEANNIADDLHTLLQDPQYRDELNSFGITFVSVQNFARRSAVLSDFMKVSNYGFDLTIRLLRRYQSDHPEIKQYGGNS